MLIYLNNIQRDMANKVDIKDLIFSEKYSEKSFNIEIHDRRECIEALYNNREFDAYGKGESVQNLTDRVQGYTRFVSS